MVSLIISKTQRTYSTNLLSTTYFSMFEYFGGMGFERFMVLL